jgi:hypothetical protein
MSVTPDSYTSLAQLSMAVTALVGFSFGILLILGFIHKTLQEIRDALRKSEKP